MALSKLLVLSAPRAARVAACPKIRATVLLVFLLTALLSRATFAAPPTATPAEAPTGNSTGQPATPVTTPEQSGTALESPEVSGGALPLLPAQSSDTEVSGGVLPLLPAPETPAVARGVEVEESPLLVTEPPEGENEVEIPVPVTGGNDSTLNPFSPLLLPQPPQQAAPAPPAAPAQQPAAPPAVAAPPAEAVPAPAPTTTSAAAAPEPAPAVEVPLPQARTGRPNLPRGLAANLRTTVPLTADLSASPLERALGRGTDDANALGPTSELAAVRAPPSLTPLGTAPSSSAPARIPSGAQQIALGSGLSTLGLGAGDGNFTSLGGNRVSRALSSLQVHFTAMVTGTAIFRVGDGTTPILLAPGEALPGTELVLTNLTSRSAQFTEDDVRHTLFLTP